MGTLTPGLPPTRILSWQQEVLYADPDWNQNYRNPWIYEFSNGRLFYTTGPGNPGQYDGNDPY